MRHIILGILVVCFFLKLESYGQISSEAVRLSTKRDTLNYIQKLDSLGLVSIKELDFPKAEEKLMLSLRLKLIVKDTLALINSYRLLGRSAAMQKDRELAVKYFFQYLELAEQLKDTIHLGRANNNLGLIHVEMDQHEKAKPFLNDALKFKLLSGESFKKLSNTYNNLGLLYEEINELDTAISHYSSALKIRQEIGDSLGIPKLMNNLGFVAQKRKDFDTALDYYLGALPNSNDDLRRKLYSNISTIYYNTGKCCLAYEYLYRYDTLNTRIFNHTKSQQVAALREQFDAEKNEKELAQNRIEIQESKIRQNKILLGFSMILCLVLVVIAILIGRQRFLKLVNQKNVEKHKNEVERILKEQEINSFDSMIDGQEKERKRIAEDLHDRLGNTLSAFRVHFEAMVSLNQSETDTTLIFDLIDKAIDETRQVSHNLLSGVLMKFGLIAALQDLKSSIVGNNIIQMNIQTIQFEGRLELEKEINMYRIVQEAVSNTLRHASANKIDIEVEKTDDRIMLKVKDDGIGMNRDSIQRGIGLRNMESRAAKLGSELVITSAVGHGTEIALNMEYD